MTFRDWIDNNGADNVKEELEEILKDIGDCEIEFENDDEWFYVRLSFADDSYLSTEFEFENDVEDDYTSKTLLMDLFDSVWEGYCDMPEMFSKLQENFLQKLRIWEQSERGFNL